MANWECTKEPSWDFEANGAGGAKNLVMRGKINGKEKI